LTLDLVDVVVPENSEGTEATVLRWCHKIGDRVAEHQPCSSSKPTR